MGLIGSAACKRFEKRFNVIAFGRKGPAASTTSRRMRLCSSELHCGPRLDLPELAPRSDQGALRRLDPVNRLGLPKYRQIDAQTFSSTSESRHPDTIWLLHGHQKKRELFPEEMECFGGVGRMDDRANA